MSALLDIAQLLKNNRYPGRGIVLGLSEDGKKAVAAYFIMGRSENSRNRVFKKRENGDIFTAAFDESKVKDPSLIIYNAVRRFENKLIVTNGDQTDTVYDFLAAGKGFEQALDTREFEPDFPNFTPRISGLLTFEKDRFTYKMSILKSADEAGSACNRFTFAYAPQAGTGHFIHTYQEDGNPLPSFAGEPEPIALGGDIDDFSGLLWDSLDLDNKISLYVCFTDLVSGAAEERIMNKNQ